MKCPVGNLKEARRDGFEFYSPKDRDKPRPSPWVKERPSFDELEAAAAGEMFDMTIDGMRWRRIPQEVTWTLARDDANHPCSDPLAKPKPTPRHIHCDFEFSGDLIHVDYLLFMQWGPLSGFAEFQFFVNGQFRSRGGYFACYGMFQRAMPACLRTDTYAVIANGNFAGAVLPPFTGLSVWRIESMA